MATLAAATRSGQATLLRHAEAVQAVCFLPRVAQKASDTGATGDGAQEGAAEPERVVTGDAAGTLRVWDTYTRRATLTQEAAHDGEFGVLYVTALDVSEPSSNAEDANTSTGDTRQTLVLSQGRDGKVRAWTAQSLEPRWTAQTSSFGFCLLSASDVRFACPKGEDGKLALWNLSTGDLEEEISSEAILRDYMDRGALPRDVSQRDASLGLCMSLCFQDRVLFALFECGSLGIYELEKKAWAVEVCLHALSREVPIAMSIVSAGAGKPHKYLGAAVGADSEFAPFIVDLTKRKAKCVDRRAPLRESGPTSASRQGASGIAVRADLDLVAVGCWDGSVRAYQWSSLSSRGVLHQHKGAIRAVSFSCGDPAVLAAASEDGNVSLVTNYPHACSSFGVE
ncbi:Protein DECREASED SIZE EXCLUSION LIMIT 1 [Hondaea fermentalgiana]|uniref:Protein DECREASED SIZE EXCLUSION LIMIT 1 n=1 Tax=Hondaea fermentalgiana TaxID=2315210 RepID=A0A2R5FZ27_9STRA|nr:Protein DECREASED SIZE EXCLUSION LIMIT 1 [Hondaea fermentalgiana]|eukprot:GBG24006.1 Protein DECREASED SIZE EXCLUSION LIMIT 1 [Hondaea fermentalgiana]